MKKLKEFFNVFKYLDIIHADDMKNSIDFDRVLNKFLRQYISMYHKFNFAIRVII